MLALISANVYSVSKGEETQPGIVFFLVDGVGRADTGCFGSSLYETPDFEALSRACIAEYS